MRGEPLEVGCALLRHPHRQPLPTEQRDDEGTELSAHAGDAAGVLAAHEHRGAGRRQRPAQPGQRGVAGDVDDHVVAVRDRGEVVAGVVEHVRGAQRPHQVGLGRAGHAGDLGAGGHRDLHRIAADPARGAGDEDALAGLHSGQVGDRLEGGDGGDRDRGRLLVREPAGLDGQLALLGDGVLGERPGADAVDLVAGGEPGHRGADRGDGAGQVEAGDGLLGPAQAHDQPNGVRRPGHQVPRAAVEARRVHADQHLVVAEGAGERTFRGPEDLGVAVGLLHDRSHGGRRGRDGSRGGCRAGCGTSAGHGASPWFRTKYGDSIVLCTTCPESR